MTKKAKTFGDLKVGSRVGMLVKDTMERRRFTVGSINHCQDKNGKNIVKIMFTSKYLAGITVDANYRECEKEYPYFKNLACKYVFFADKSARNEYYNRMINEYERLKALNF